MKLLKDILYQCRIDEVKGSTNIAIENICFDSRKANQFSAFVAVRGLDSDGHNFITNAIDAGALAVVCEEFPTDIRDDKTYIKVKDSRAALAFIAANFYDNPSQKIKLIGVTGTNGKTTTVTLLHNLFMALGHKSGLISTVVNKIGNKEIPSTHTTPDPISLNKLLKTMLDEKCSFCFMEVSSHAIDQKRVSGLKFEIAMFTNITHDHLDYHKTFDNYIKAKKGFFDMLPDTAYALLNKDDYHWEIMVQNTKAKVKTLALKSSADFKAKVLENSFNGMVLQIDNMELHTKLVGGFNGYNILGVYGAAILLGQEKIEVLTELSSLSTVEGRFQYIKSKNQVHAIVDYAHTPDALKNVLSTIKDLRTGNETVITVVGCGGNRDKEKRPIMASIACKWSNMVILTSDNPRHEEPESIIEEMRKGVEPIDYKKTLSITNRKEAIRTACTMAKSGDIILVAGKGHEKYQEIKGERFDFDDLGVLKEMFESQII
jgi:UDP-N-acetylmuramoyl-L-alanyl-D-glutamate--2,6-diaminopimelate ligase